MVFCQMVLVAASVPEQQYRGCPGDTVDHPEKQRKSRGHTHIRNSSFELSNGPQLIIKLRFQAIARLKLPSGRGAFQAFASCEFPRLSFDSSALLNYRQNHKPKAPIFAVKGLAVDVAAGQPGPQTCLSNTVEVIAARRQYSTSKRMNSNGVEARRTQKTCRATVELFYNSGTARIDWWVPI